MIWKWDHAEPLTWAEYHYWMNRPMPFGWGITGKPIGDDPFMVKIATCPKCGSDKCFPTHIGNNAVCVPCGHEFNMLGPWWRRLGRAIGIAA